MTDLMNTDLPWDDDEQLFDRSEPEGTGGKRYFAKLQMLVPSVTKAKDKKGRFVSGHHFVLPGVVGGQYDDQDENGLMKFKSFDLGGDEKLFIFVVTKEDKEGNEYQIVKSYPDRKYTKDDQMIFADYIMPALREGFTAKSRNQLLGDGVWCEFENIPTGEVFTDDDGEEHDINYWGNFKVYASKEEMVTASEEFFAQFSGDSDTSQVIVKDYHPAAWDKDEPYDYAAWVQHPEQAEKSPEQVAKDCGVVDADGKPAIAVNGEPVDVNRVVAELMNVPPATINL